MGAQPHHGDVEAHTQTFEAATALAWLAAAGADVIVDDAPRNWLAAPPRQAPLVTVVAAQPQRSTSRPAGQPAANPAAALAAAAVDFAGLDLALAEFPHPLRRPAPPQLISGNAASGILVLIDQPDEPNAPALRLLGRMLAAIGLDSTNAAQGHLLPWAPPAGRAGRDEEIAAFAPFLARALALAAPRCILALGDKAAGLANRAPAEPVRGIAATRGKWLALGDVPMIASFHPRQLLAQPELKRLAWADLQAFQTRIAA